MENDPEGVAADDTTGIPEEAEIKIKREKTVTQEEQVKKQ